MLPHLHRGQPSAGGKTFPVVLRNAGDGIEAGRRSTILDRIVLLITIILIPRVDTVVVEGLRRFGDFSAAWLLFLGLGVYALFRRPSLSVLRQAVVLAALGFLAAGFLLESAHAGADYDDLFRFAQTVVASVLISCLCVDRPALKVALWGIILGSLWLSVEVYRSSYDVLRSASASSFREASQVRDAAFEQSGVEMNLNRLGFLCAAGLVACVALGAGERRTVWRLVYLGAAIFTLPGTFLPQSRSAVIAAAGGSALVLLASGGKRTRALMIAAPVALAVWLVIPKTAFARFQRAEERAGMSEDARVRVYSVIWSALPEYWLGGVGAGRYHESWALSRGLGRSAALGAHNCMLQILVYWGVVGLMFFLNLLWWAARCLPRNLSRDPLALALLGVAAATGVRLLFTHNFYSKDFAIVLGLLTASRLWVWPQGVIFSPKKLQRPHPT